MAKQGQKKRFMAVIAALVMVLGYTTVALSMSVEASSPVKSALSPYFSQKWNVFAPNIQKKDYFLEVRNRSVNSDGKTVESEWIPVTAIERRGNKGSLAQSRIQKLSQNVSTAYLSRYNKLKSDQRTSARKDFVSVSQSKRKVMSDDEIIELLKGEQKNSSAVVRFVRMDYMLVRYATVFTEAHSDTSADEVQWRVVRKQNNDFAHRFMESDQFEDRITTFGWRASDAGSYEPAVEELEQIIDRQEGR
ncbi:DUF5819 family protein [Arthrobacter sp. MYb213]|uniref:DUF5819 family protein n=1 Tax=Arthrobacter sp. MYb213 TaxID=1848595 RepID=UPI000CFB12D8|nr:DUF5819 family protein [Arthrobacter sp. MYb213]PRB71670.1 hypothetical protein CQ011_07255 [Arthrobacter sp. MYb213]